MPDQYKIIYDPQALRDLDLIFEYIQKESPQNAAIMVDRLTDAIDSLDILPHRYNVPRNMNRVNREVRSMPVPPFLVFYRIEETPRAVFILHLRHGARDSPS